MRFARTIASAGAAALLLGSPAEAAQTLAPAWQPHSVNSAAAFRERVAHELERRRFIRRAQASTGAGTKPSAGSGYVGPGDVAGISYVEAYGSQALTAATRGNKLYNVCLHSSTATCADALSDATTGLLNLPSPGATLCGAVGGANECDIHIAYSLTGTGHDATDGGVTANRPPLDPTGVNGHPALKCTGSSLLVNSTIAATNSPFSMVVVASRTNPVFFDAPFDSNSNTVDVVFNAGGGSLHFDAAGASPDVTYTEGNIAAILGTNDGTNTSVSINGSGLTGNPTSATTIGTDIAICGASGSTNQLTGYVAFAGYGATAFSNPAAISSNFHTIWNN